MKNIKRYQYMLAGLIGVVMASMFTGCTEDIDMSNRYTFTEYTVLSYLEEHEEYSEYVELLKQVKISDIKIGQLESSTVAQLLSARGNFTCFAPNNEAIQLYLDTLQRKGIIKEATWDGLMASENLDSIRKVIVYNSIIDGGDVTYYETSTFPKSGYEFHIANLNDRKLNVIRGEINSDSIYINGEYPLSMQHRDIEAINGRIHEMLQVIAPSNDTMADIFRKWIEENEGNYRVMGKLLLACGLGDTLSKVRDENWETYWLTKDPNIGDFDKDNPKSGIPPEHRKYGFTIFAETDDTWESLLPGGKTAVEITVEDINNYLVAQGAYPEADKGDNFKDPNNIVYQFVTYHILPMTISRDKLVVHYNEKGYNYASSRNYTIATAEYYTTMGKPRLLKVYESFESQGIYLNRFPVLRNGRGRFSPEEENINDYHESGEFCEIRGLSMRDDENEGVKVENSTDANLTTESALNGVIYPIQKLLVYTDNVQTQLQRQRIRFDLASILPEMMSNDIRRPLEAYPTLHASYRGFPTDYQYFNNIEIKDGSRFYYLNGLGKNWYNWQGDEFNIIGRYEFIIKLPPVPKEGNYELRLAVQSNSNLRGMCQVYWGPNKNSLPAIGIPLDMRMGGQYRRLTNSTQPSIVGWVADSQLDGQEAIDEVDKMMRNNGFMKGPEHFSPTPGSSTTARQLADHTRRIMVSARMDPNETYYLKFKSVLDDELKQFFIDYIEYCAKEVYDNPVESEDIW